MHVYEIPVIFPIHYSTFIILMVREKNKMIAPIAYTRRKTHDIPFSMQYVYEYTKIYFLCHYDIRYPFHTLLKEIWKFKELIKQPTLDIVDLK